MMPAKLKPLVRVVTCNAVCADDDIYEYQFARGRRRECLHSVDGRYSGIAKHLCKMLEKLGHTVIRQRIGFDGKVINDDQSKA